VLQTLHISFSLISSPKYSLVRSAHYEAPHSAISSSLPLLPLSSVHVFSSLTHLQSTFGLQITKHSYAQLLKYKHSVKLCFCIFESFRKASRNLMRFFFFFFFFFFFEHRTLHASLQCLNLRQSVGLFGGWISPSQGPYLTQTHK
jgi:hypothetical protein